MVTDSHESATQPPVSVIIATRDRPELLRSALESVLRQDYAGRVECLIVFDHVPPDFSIARSDGPRTVRVLANTRRPGLAGSRNTGILAATSSIIAFCDDDDAWRTQKLRLQVSALAAAQAVGVVCGITVHYGGRSSVRIPRTGELTRAGFTRDRVAAVHSSSLVLDRAAVLDVGLVDENIPGAYGEDYDLLLRLVDVGAIVSVEQPLVDVLWHEGSYFAERWRTIVDALDYLVAKHPQFAASAAGLARLDGQRAFALAALGERGPALHAVLRSVRGNWRERRAYLAMLVLAHLVTPQKVLHAAHSRGRGI
jgi:glycosyltransferase involved in cell wall biosynthesis